MIDFDGPLDLILYLLSKNKVEIENIPLALIVEQYLEWIDVRKQLDLEVASEFITMASHLIYLKTRMLLKVGEDRDEEVDQLILSLEERRRQEEYKKIKNICPELNQRWEFGRNIITRDQEKHNTIKRFTGNISPQKLISAFARIRFRAEQKIPPPVSAFSGIVGRDPYPVSQKLEEVIQTLFTSRTIQFHSLLHQAKSRSEAAATFLAVLELYKNDQIQIQYSASDYSLVLVHGEKGNQH